MLIDSEVQEEKNTEYSIALAKPFSLHHVLFPQKSVFGKMGIVPFCGKNQLYGKQGGCLQAKWK